MPGPVSMAVAIENREDRPLAVIVGDAEFAGNRVLNSPDGRSGYVFLQSALNWLRDRPDLLGDIPARHHEPYRLAGTSEQHRQLVWIPLMMLLAFTGTGGIVSGLRLRG